MRWDRVWRRCAGRWREFALSVGPATGWKVWNPGLYGERWHRRFRRLYPPGERPLVIFGLNPGLYGMAQTGIPFTDIRRLVTALPALAEDLRGAGERLEVPGLAPRSLRPYLSRTFESSAVRVYRFLERGWGGAERGWRDVVVANPCSLLFVDPAAGKNRTPAHLPRPSPRRRSAGSTSKDLRSEADRLRRICATDAIQALHPRGAVLLGEDVRSVLGDCLFRLLGERLVLAFEHPARAVPEKWASGLLAALHRRDLL